MSPDDARHGTYAGWQAHRKDQEEVCDACEMAAFRYHKKKHVRLGLGIKNRITLGATAWDIIHDNPRRAVHLSTGIPVSKLCQYHNGGPETPVLRATRENIERFTPIDVFTAVGIQRRVRALNRLGYSAAAIAVAAECHVESIKDVRRVGHTPRFVSTSFAERVGAAYDRLSMTLPAPSRAVSKARGTATRNGWAPPLAWDNIDDPAESPQGMKVGRNTDIQATRAYELEHLAFMGESLPVACQRLGVGQDALWKWCDNNGALDLFRRLAENGPARHENQFTKRGAA